MEAERSSVRKRTDSEAVDNASTEATVATVQDEHGPAHEPPSSSSFSDAAQTRDLQTPSPRMIAPRARVPVDSNCIELMDGKNKARGGEPPAALTFASLLSTAHTTEMRCGAWDEDSNSTDALCDSECVAGLLGQTVPPAPPLPPCPMRRKRSLSDADHSALYVSYTFVFIYLCMDYTPCSLLVSLFFCQAATQTMVSSLKEGSQPSASSKSPPVCLSHFQESPRKRPAPAPAQRSARSLSNEEGLFPPLRTVHSDNKLPSLDGNLSADSSAFSSTAFSNSIFSNSAFSNFAARLPTQKPSPFGLSIPPPVPSLRSPPTRSRDAAVTPPHLAPPPPLDAVGGSPAGGGLTWAAALATSPSTATEAGGVSGTGGASSPNSDSPNLRVAAVEVTEPASRRRGRR